MSVVNSAKLKAWRSELLAGRPKNVFREITPRKLVGFCRTIERGQLAEPLTDEVISTARDLRLTLTKLITDEKLKPLQVMEELCGEVKIAWRQLKADFDSLQGKIAPLQKELERLEAGGDKTLDKFRTLEAGVAILSGRYVEIDPVPQATQLKNWEQWLSAGNYQALFRLLTPSKLEHYCLMIEHGKDLVLLPAATISAAKELKATYRELTNTGQLIPTYEMENIYIEDGETVARLTADLGKIETAISGIKPRSADDLLKGIDRYRQGMKIRIAGLQQAVTVTPALAMSNEAGGVPTAVIPFDPINYPFISYEASQLRDKVRMSGQPLLFTRNTDLGELADIVQAGKIRTNGGGVKYFRYGLGHEYGNNGSVVTIVMKKEFWADNQARGRFVNLFLLNINGAAVEPNTVRITEAIPLTDGHEKIQAELAGKVEYNRFLQVRDEAEEQMFDGFFRSGPGHTVVNSDVESFMGNYPQLEVSHDISLDQVEGILVPEHLWAEAQRLAGADPRIAPLLRKVEGTGKTKEEFLDGREKLGRRSRFNSGKFEPTFGYESFYLFEQAYFAAVVAEQARPLVESRARAQELMTKYNYQPVPASCWIYGYPTGEALPRDENDWKIFVNPREERFLEVLESVLRVLRDNAQLGITFKIPFDLKAEWRPGRPFGAASNTPKIVVYVNQQTLPAIAKALEAALANIKDAGFGDLPGPSFARRVGAGALMFYKKELFAGGIDVRVELAKEAEREAAAAGVTDPAEIMHRKEVALWSAGFVGENYYKGQKDIDPLDP